MFAEEKESPAIHGNMVMTYLTFHGIISEFLDYFKLNLTNKILFDWTLLLHFLIL